MNSTEQKAYAQEMERTIASLTTDLAAARAERDVHLDLVIESHAAKALWDRQRAKLMEACGTSEPSAGHDWVDEVCGLLRVARCQRDAAWAERDEAIDHAKKGAAFKVFTHTRFDQIGVPKEFPDGEHSKEGCRVGDRIDWIEEHLATDLLIADLAAARADAVEANRVSGNWAQIYATARDGLAAALIREHALLAVVAQADGIREMWRRNALSVNGVSNAFDAYDAARAEVTP